MGKIGIMGGTFDPVHNGHLHLGRQAYVEYGLDSIWFMPSGQPPHKKNHEVTDMEHRCRMLQLAIEGNGAFVFSDFEVRREGNTYTAQTLALLREAYPEHEFYFILGADSLYEIETWYHPEEVIGSVVILAASREYEDSHRPMKEQIAYLNQKYAGRIRMLHSTEVDISSEAIRNMAARGETVVNYVPEKVAAYIEAQGLYRDNGKAGTILPAEEYPVVFQEAGQHEWAGNHASEEAEG